MKVHIGKYRKNRRINIQIDPWDTWNMDETLALIILPMLKQLKATKHGSGYVDLEDIPEHLRFTEHSQWNQNYTFDFYRDESEKYESNIHARYDWLLDELIWTFEQLQPDCYWEDQYCITSPELDLEKYPGDKGKTSFPVSWKVKGQFDREGIQKHNARIVNGLKLFGKYFQTLWD